MVRYLRRLEANRLVIRDGDLWQLPADFWDRLAAEVEQNCPTLERLQELRTDCAEEAEALHAEDILRTGETIFRRPGLRVELHRFLPGLSRSGGVVTQLISRKATRSPYNPSHREERQMSQEQQFTEQSAWNRFLDTRRVEPDFQA